jgi:ATP-dependent Clp protease ATP-binding subunit ClpB
MELEAMEALRGMVRPEFLNRIDDVIVFEPITKTHLREIVELQLRVLKGRLDHAGIQLCVSDEALTWLADQGYSPSMGARPLKRLIQREVLNTLSKSLLAGKVTKDEPLVMDVFDGEVVFRGKLREEACLMV